MEFNDTLVLLSVALGSSERCREKIKEKYKENEENYLWFYQRSGLDETGIFQRFTFNTAEAIKQCYLIVVDETYRGSDLFINRMIKMAYKPAFTFYTHKRFDYIEEFLPWYTEKQGGLEKISGIYLDYSFYVLTYLSLRDKKQLSKSPMLKTINEHYIHLLRYPSLEELDIDDEGLNYKGYRTLIDKLDIDGKIDEEVSTLFENIRLNEELEIMGELSKSDGFMEVRDKVSQMPITRVVNHLNLALELFGLNSTFLKDARISNKEVEKLVKYSYILKNTNGGDDRETEILFISTLVIYAIVQEYKQLRQEHYEELKATSLETKLNLEQEKSKLEEELESKNRELKEQLRAYKTLKKESEDRFRELEERVKRAELENKRLKSELEDSRSDEKELLFLREHYFNQSKTEEIPLEEVSIEGILDKLQTLQAVVVGGHVGLQNKLKQELPNYTFITDEETSRDVSFIKGKQVVFYSSHYNNHTIYRKVMKEIKSSDVTLVYVKRTQNIDMLLTDMYQKCKEQKLIR